MRSYLQKPWFVFVLTFLVIALPLFLLPINLFQGEVTSENGLVKFIEQKPLSLSYFIGLGYKQEEMTYITDFHLLWEGWMLAASLLIGFPALLAYRAHIRNK